MPDDTPPGTPADEACLTAGTVRWVTGGAGPLMHHRIEAHDGGGWVAVGRAERAGGGAPAALLRVRQHCHVAADLVDTVAEVAPERLVLTGPRTRQVVSGCGDHLHVRLEVELEQPRLDHLMAAFAFLPGATDFVHTPALAQDDTDIASDRSFCQPAAILQRGTHSLCLVPDLDALARESPVAHGVRTSRHASPWALPEADAQPMTAALWVQQAGSPDGLPVAFVGFADTIGSPHVHWCHPEDGSMVRELAGRTVVLAYRVWASALSPPAAAYREVSRRLWAIHGSAKVREVAPQAMPLAEYARVCFAAAAAPGSNGGDDKRPGWLAVEEPGLHGGGFRFPINEDIQFTAWWNNARDAVGIHRWGTRLNDATLIERARQMVELALSAPRTDGVFPAVYRREERRWLPSHWAFPREVDENAVIGWTPAGPGDDAVYQVAAASKTALWLLRYHRRCEADERIVELARGWASVLLARLEPDGSIPMWLHGDLTSSRWLDRSAEGGMHIAMLCELWHAAPDEDLLVAARRMAAFLTREVLPDQRWHDFETFHSCAGKPISVHDQRSGQPARCALSMIWAVEGLTELALIDDDPALLDAAQAVADYLSFYQAIWQPPFITTARVFGGFTSQNTDDEWLDMRQAIAAEALVRLGLAAHRTDLIERGVAAARAQLVLISHPRHVANGWRVPSRFPVGTAPENVDHSACAEESARSGPDWGEVGAMSSLATVLDMLGSAYVDPGDGFSIGVDGIAVHLDGGVAHVRTQLGDMTQPWTDPYPAQLRVAGVEQAVPFVAGTRMSAIDLD